MNLSKAFDWLDRQADSMADDLETLCNLNSGSDHLAGLLRVADWLQEFFQPISGPCQRIALAPFRSVDDRGNALETETGPALRWDWWGNQARNAANLPKPLLLTIHYDTVYGLENSFQRCERLEGHRMRGPGVIDAKGGIVVLRYAALAASQFLQDTPLRFSIVLTPDEEIGSPSSVQLWREICHEFSFAMLFEPAMADGSLVSTRKGTGTFVFQVEGRSAHAGRNFSAGRNAIVHASVLVQELHQLNGQRENVTINIGRISGGDAVNVVPDHTIFRVNVRVADADDQIWIERQVHRLVEKYDTPSDGYRVRVEGGVYSPPKLLDAPTQQWMRWVDQDSRALGQPTGWKPSGGASDGNKLQALGLPNIDTFGPDGDGLHSDQEWIDLRSLPRKASLVFRLLARQASIPSW